MPALDLGLQFGPPRRVKQQLVSGERFRPLSHEQVRYLSAGPFEGRVIIGHRGGVTPFQRALDQLLIPAGQVTKRLRKHRGAGGEMVGSGPVGGARLLLHDAQGKRLEAVAGKDGYGRIKQPVPRRRHEGAACHDKSLSDWRRPSPDCYRHIRGASARRERGRLTAWARASPAYATGDVRPRGTVLRPLQHTAQRRFRPALADRKST